MKLALVILLVFNLTCVIDSAHPTLGGEFPNFCSKKEECFSRNCHKGVCGPVVYNRKRRDIVREITDEILGKLHCAYYSSCGSHVFCPFDEFCFRVPAVFP
ncbi:unnamed protein product [Caenorhabditis brenneri]